MRAPRVTLLQVFAGSIAAIALLLGSNLLLFLTATRRSILQSAEALRAAAARFVHPGGGGFVLDRRERPVGGGVFSGSLASGGAAPDPTEHLTFRTPASR